MTAKKHSFQELSSVELQTVDGGNGVLTAPGLGITMRIVEQVVNFFT